MEQKTNGKAIASLVLGILSLVCIFFGYGALLGIVFGIVGLVLGINANKEGKTGMATAGIVMSAIGLGLCAITFIACVACVGCLGAAVGLDNLY
ncbi:MAG TPA: DUF4190 domain-containing protein [Lachnospiraceae bacterium]|nr:DUF4190 domain-containing protein [Lachnospiraceae bacterium]